MKATILIIGLLMCSNAFSHDSMIDHPHYANRVADADEHNTESIRLVIREQKEETRRDQEEVINKIYYSPSLLV